MTKSKRGANEFIKPHPPGVPLPPDDGSKFAFDTDLVWFTDTPLSSARIVGDDDRRTRVPQRVWDRKLPVAAGDRIVVNWIGYNQPAFSVALPPDVSVKELLKTVQRATKAILDPASGAMRATTYACIARFSSSDARVQLATEFETGRLRLSSLLTFDHGRCIMLGTLERSASGYWTYDT